MFKLATSPKSGFNIENVRQATDERHDVMRRLGLYKVFTDEIIPLSLVALKIYPNTYSVKPVIGNQGYDAIVKDELCSIVDYIESVYKCHSEA